MEISNSHYISRNENTSRPVGVKAKPKRNYYVDTDRKELVSTSSDFCQVVLCSEVLVLLVKTTCQDQQDNENAFGTSEAFIALNQLNRKRSLYYDTGVFIFDAV